MSVEPQALERSVLERKERDELAAIAEAMGVKAGARTSKANLIGQILREAGIETGDDKPKRATKPKSENGAGTDAVEQAEVPAEEAGGEAPSEQPAAAETTTEQQSEDEESETQPDTDTQRPQNQERQGGGSRGNQQAYGGVAEPG